MASGKGDEIRDTDERRIRLDQKPMFYGEYPNIDAEQYPSGRQIVVGNEQGAEYYRSESRRHYNEGVESSNYRETSFNKGPVHKGTPQGITTTTGKSEDSMVGDNQRSGVFKSTHGEVKKWSTSAKGKGSVSKHDGPSAHGSLGSQWSVHASNSPGGDGVFMGDGDQHSSTRGDRVAYHVGTHVTVNKGERYEDVQEGNKGTVVGKKYKMHSKEDMTLESESKITLKVGSSYVILTPAYVIAYYQSPANASMLVNSAHVHIRKNDNRIFVDDTGCWSTKAMAVKDDGNDNV